jgi:hypothetical protein
VARRQQGDNRTTSGMSCKFSRSRRYSVKAFMVASTHEASFWSIKCSIFSEEHSDFLPPFATFCHFANPCHWQWQGSNSLPMARQEYFTLPTTLISGCFGCNLIQSASDVAEKFPDDKTTGIEDIPVLTNRNAFFAGLNFKHHCPHEIEDGQTSK